MIVPLVLALLLTAPAPTPLCQPEPKDSPAREAVWDAHIAALPTLEQGLPAQPDPALLMPIAGVRVSDIVGTWGAARGGGLKHAGQDIFARRGTPVLSATIGTVWMIGASVRGGTWVYVLGAGGRRYYYAHLERVAAGLKEGQKVSTSTVLGTVGTTGDAEDTPPHLHFALFGRPHQDGPCRFPAFDPLPLLRNR